LQTCLRELESAVSVVTESKDRTIWERSANGERRMADTKWEDAS